MFQLKRPNKASQNRAFGAGLANARLCLRRYVKN